MREDALTILRSEFKLWGVKFEANYLNSGHIELVWRATPDKETRRYIIAKTSSDWRGALNARAKIRQMFRQDGLLSLKEQCVKPKPALHKALAMPEPVEKDADQIKILRAEVADLTEMVMELAGVITSLRDHVTPAPAPIPEPEPVKPPEIVKPSVRSIKAIEFVSEGWNTTDAIARDMRLPKEIAYRKLYYLTKTDEVELCGGSWRKKPPLRLVAAE